MTEWIEYLAAFGLFLGSHAVPARPGLRAWLAGRLGERGYLLLYSLVSLLLLGWLIDAAGRAPYVGLWDFAPWQLWGPSLALPLVCLLLALALLTPNPLSFGGRRNAAFEPEMPGVIGLTRHPLLVAIALWAGAHLLPNGDLAHVGLFGSFLAIALLAMPALDRRLQKRLGAERWRELAAHTSAFPGLALLSGRWRPTPPRRADLPALTRRLLAAALIYGGLLLSHEAVIGVSPFPL